LTAIRQNRLGFAGKKKLVVVMFGKKMPENFSDGCGQRQSAVVGGSRRWSAAGSGSDDQQHKVVVVNGGEKKLQQ